MKKTMSVSLVMLVVCTFGLAHAALIDRGNGLIYDTELNITWLKDANYPGTSGNPITGGWNDALAWVANLNYMGITGWRLPTTPLGTLSQSEQYRTPGQGEMGHLYNNDGINGGSPGPFVNLTISIWGSDNARWYWTSTAGPDYSSGVQTAVIFNFSTPVPGGWGGYEILTDRSFVGAAWPVHDGDVGSTLPPAPLEGTWYFQVFADNPLSNAPYWGSGTMILDWTGAVKGGTAINDSGGTKTLTGGSLSIDSIGQVAGTVTLSDGAIESLPHGKLDAGKTVLTMVNSDPNYRGLFVAIKGDGTFMQADLTGTWYFQVFGDSPSANAPYWAAGAMNLDSAGAVTGGTVINDSGTTKTLTGGSLSIDSSGLVAGSVTLSDSSIESLPHGKLNSGKTFLSMVNSDSKRGLFVAAKGGGTFAQADLAGIWYVQAIADNPSINNPYWASGTMIIDATGAVTGGTLVNSFGETKQLTGGSFTIDSLGRFSGSFLQSDGQTGDVPYGKLDSGKGILTMVASNTSNRGLFIASKGGTAGTCSGDFTSDGDVDGGDLAMLIATPSSLDLGTFAQNFGRNTCQ